VEDRFGSLPEPAQHLVFLTSLRLRASDAAVQAVTATPDEIIVKFDRLPALNIDQVASAARVSIKRGSNQLRFERGKGLAWMERLYALVSALPRMGAADLPGLMAPALRSA
jgi:transcription-repair coupling factor (superfamily II helicase)